MDTSAFTHWHRAGHGDILRRVAPTGRIVLIPDVLDDVDRSGAERIVDDLLATDMWLPIRTGASLVPWAYEVGYLPWGTDR